MLEIIMAGKSTLTIELTHTHSKFCKVLKNDIPLLVIIVLRVAEVLVVCPIRGLHFR